jgi:outer membrane lipoprotein-sorting protein
MKFLLALLFAFTITAAHADQATPVQLSPEDQAEVERIGTYLNDITTAKADFLQTAPNGLVAGGTFYLSRPGKLRFDYVQPNKDIIVADGSSIWYYDSKLKDASHTSISSTLADFLLRRTIKLSGDITVTDFQHGNGMAEIVLTQTSDPGAGSLTLVLSEKPLQLRQWRVVDAEQKATEVTLQDPQFGLPLDPNLFVFHEPKH